MFRSIGAISWLVVRRVLVLPLIASIAIACSEMPSPRTPNTPLAPQVTPKATPIASPMAQLVPAQPLPYNANTLTFQALNDRLWLLGLNNQLYRTADAGQTWQSIGATADLFMSG